MRTHVYSIYCLILVALFSSACTRSVDSKLGVTIVIPTDIPEAQGRQYKVDDGSPTAMAVPAPSPSPSFPLPSTSGRIRHLVVNIQGPGAPGMLEFDAKDGAISGSVAVTVPGGAYNIQVGAYIENPGSNRYLAYGDAAIVTTPGNQEVKVSVAKIANSTGLEGKMMGRLNVKTGYPLTGRVTGYMKIPGKPAMPMIRTDIFAGWFSFFVIDGADFKYQLDGATTPIFESLKIANVATEPEILVNGASLKDSVSYAVMQYHVPPHHRHDWGTMLPQVKEDNGNVVMMAWYDDGILDMTKDTCYKPSEPTGTFNSSGAFYQHPVTDWENPDYLEWDFNGFDPYMLSRVGTAGGDACSGDPLLDYLGFDIDAMETGSFNSGLPFEGMTTNTWSGRFGIGSTGTPGQLRVQFESLPEVWSDETVGGIEGVDVFAINNSIVDVEDPVPSCAKAAGLGWTSAGTITYGGTSTIGCEGDSSCKVDIDGLWNDQNDTLAIGCPWRTEGGSKKYLNTVMRTSYGRWGVGSYNITPAMADGMVDFWMLPSAASNGVSNCRLVKGDFSTTPEYSTLFGLLKLGDANYTIHAASDGNCSQAPITQLKVLAGDPGPVQFRVKTTTPGIIKIMPYTISTNPSVARMFSPWGSSGIEFGSGYEIGVDGSNSRPAMCGGTSIYVTITLAGSAAPINNPLGPISFTVDNDPSGWTCDDGMTIGNGWQGADIGYSGPAGIGTTNIVLDTTLYPDVRIRPGAGSMFITP